MDLNLKEINTDNINYYLKLILDQKPKTTKLNNEITVNYKQLAVNLYIIATLNEFKISYKTEFFILDNFSTDIVYNRFTNIYEFLIEKYNDSNIYYKFKWYVWYYINFINNFIIENCSEYQYSLDVENIVKTIDHPKIKEIINTKINKKYSVTNIEKQIDNTRYKLIDALSKLNIPENQFKELINLNMINRSQLSHMVLMIGFRSDLSDKTIPKVIEDNYLNGLSEDIDFIGENLSDKKSKVYNKLLMPLTQYSNRKQQLASFNLKNIYKGDCGTTETVEYFITENKAKSTLGKYIVDEKNNLILLDKNNIEKYIDKVVNLRSPLKCLYRDGTCEICGGKLVKFYMNRYFNVGHTSVLIFNSTTSQAVLSNKHHQTTTSKEYKIPNELLSIFEKRGNNIFIKSNFKNKKLKLGFDIKDARKLLNISKLSYNIDEDDIYEYNFGIYRTLIIKNNNQEITPEISLKYYNLFPRLSKSLIIYLLNNPHVIETSNNKLFIDISNYNKRDIFNVSVINFSVKSFYDNLDHFSQKVIGKFDNIDMALNEFTNIIYERSKVNLIYPELILKTYLIENEIDFRITNTENKDTVNFGFIKDINKYRSLGAALAFEQHLDILRSPLTYLIPKDLSPMDIFLNLNI